MQDIDNIKFFIKDRFARPVWSGK